jgi:non-ribosomal peptide synthetase-like protein
VPQDDAWIIFTSGTSGTPKGVAVTHRTAAAVTTYEPLPGVVELVAYYTLDDHAVLGRQAVDDHLRDRLPRHMVPVYLEELAVMPILPGGKADRRSLPEPAGSARSRPGQDYVAPATPGEKALAYALAELLGLDEVSVDSHFFDDLGMSSLLAAHFCALVRERADAPPLSVKDVYQHPTVRSLADTVTELPAVPAVPAGEPDAGEVPGAGTARYVVCGALQLLAFFASVFAGAAVVFSGYTWVSATTGWVDLYLRSLAFSAGGFFLVCALPIAAKWALVGRWKPQEIQVWSLSYLRFWLVKTLIHANPLALFTGSPVYSLYLRALGAKVGRRVVIFSKTTPVCTDMLVIDDDTVIRKESSFTGYRAVAGVIKTGPVTIGREALIGEHTLLDIGTSVGNGSQLGHTSSLQAGQAMPDGQRWHGSPAERTDVDYRRVAPVPCGPLRRLAHGTTQVFTLVFVTLPLAAGAGVAALTKLPVVASLATLGARGFGMTDFYEDGLLVSTALFCGAILAGIAVIVTVPRVLRLLVKPGRAYPLYGLRHAAHRAIQFLTNIEFYLELLGDSSYVVHYLLALGYRMPDFEQTGSNFGADLEHENPFLVDIGRGTMIADGATLIDTDYTSTSFRATPLSIGPGNFLENAVAYPSGGRVGENCVIATKAMVPLDGPVRSDVGLLGSPCFEIPRSATADDRFDHLRTGEEFRRRLRAKNRHNIGTMGLFLAVRWVYVYIVTLFAMTAWDLYSGNPVAVIAGLTVATLLFSLGYFITVERAMLRFRSLRPRYCSIYDPYFWWHERYRKLMAPLIGIFDGTPFKEIVWRLVGVRVGRRLFDDGCSIAERDARADRRLLHAQHGLRHPVPLDGRRHLQVRLHHLGRRLHRRYWSPSPLRRDHGPRLTATARLLSR